MIPFVSFDSFFASARTLERFCSRLVLIAPGMALALSAAASRAEYDFYSFAQLDAGLLNQQDLEVSFLETAQGLGAVDKQTFTLESANYGGIGAGFGVSFNEFMRADGQISYIGRYPFYALRDDDSTLSLDARSASVMANVTVQTPAFSSAGVRAYAGAGLGISFNQASAMSFSDVTGLETNNRFSVDRVNSRDMAYQLKLGVSLPLDEQASLDLGYRYLNAGALPLGKSFEGLNSSNNIEGSLQSQDAELQSHALSFTMRHSLGLDNPKERMHRRDSAAFDLESAYNIGFGSYNFSWDKNNSDQTSSRESFTDLKTVVIGADQSFKRQNYVMNMRGQLGLIYTGLYEQEHFATQNLENHDQLLSGRADGDFFFSTDLAFGYEIDTNPQRNDTMTITPLVGLHLSQQRLRVDEYKIQEPSTTPSLLTDSNALHYGQFLGGFLGLQAQMQTADWLLSTRGEAHLSNYYATGRYTNNPNYQQPLSYRQYTDRALGLVIEAELARDFFNGSYFVLGGRAERWDSQDGMMKSFYNDGALKENKALNDALFSGYSVNIGFRVKR